MAAVAGGVAFSGSFAFSNSHSSAPNPAISIDDFGSLGLPLNPREGKALVQHCQKAPSDKNVRHTWEIDSSQVGHTDFMEL